MATAQQNGFDAVRLADHIGYLDSSVDAEALGNFHRIRQIKKKHLGDVPFYALMEMDECKTAVWEKFGGCAAPCEAGGKCQHGPPALRGWFEKKHGGGDSAALIEAREQAAKYLKETRAAVAEVTRLAELVKRQEDIISELRGRAMARPVMQAAGAAAGGPAREFVGGLFAFVGLAALLFLGAWAIEAAVFGG
jgi:hypothetical protein